MSDASAAAAADVIIDSQAQSKVAAADDSLDQKGTQMMVEIAPDRHRSYDSQGAVSQTSMACINKISLFLFSNYLLIPETADVKRSGFETVRFNKLTADRL